MTRKGERNELGAHGEQLATELLCSRGLKLLGQNVMFSFGEIDILMQDGETIVLVEVKTHKKQSPIDPIYKINLAKQRKLWQLARALTTRYPNRNIRVDAVTVYWKTGQETPVITHYINILS